MSTDVVGAPPTADEDAPRVRPTRVLRGVLIAVTGAALLLAVATLADWAWGPGRSTDAWAGRFGDARIVLAGGTTLPTGPDTVTRWTLESTTYGLPDDTSVLEAAFGGPVVAVGEHTWATASGTVDFPMLDDVRTDPTSWMNTGPTFVGASTAQVPDAPSFVTEAAQTAEVRRILAALGWPADATWRTSESDLGRTFRVLPTVPEAETKPGSSVFPAPRFEFAPDGTLASLQLEPWALVAGSTEVRSAQQAFDDLRHHRSAVTTAPEADVPNLVERVLGSPFFPSDDFDTPPGPITGVTLYGDCTGVIGRTHPCWVFTDADGGFAGAALAAVDDFYPRGVR